MKTISVRDTFVRKPVKENFYHGILLGILSYKGGWYVTSNRESGDGFSDIMVRIDDEDVGIIIEVKYAENGKEEEISYVADAMGHTYATLFCDVSDVKAMTTLTGEFAVYDEDDELIGSYSIEKAALK